MSEASLLLEHFDSGRIPADRIDRANGVIRGVKLLGEKSRNAPPFNHIYPPGCREGAKALLEGLKVNADHGTKDASARGEVRSVRDTMGMGYVDGVREQGDGLYGDWHFNPKHALAEDVFWEAEHNPRGIGFSINGHSNRKTPSDGGVIVEAIDRLDSIDLVSRPATTNGLFESERTMTATATTPRPKKKLRLLIESLKAARPGYARGLREAAEAGLMSPEQDYEEPAPMGPECAGKGPADVEAMDHETALKQGFRGACVAVLDDDSMDMGSKLKKLKEIMAAEEKLMGGGAKGAKGDADANDTPDDAAEEARRRQQGNLVESLQMQLRVRDLCADAGVRPGRVLRKALDACRTEAEARELIEETRATPAPPAPAGDPAPLLRPQGGARSGFLPDAIPAKVQESQQGGQQGQDGQGLTFKTAEERNTFLRGGGRR